MTSAGNEELREQILTLWRKEFPPRMNSDYMPEDLLNDLVDLITASHTKPKALVKEEPYYLRNYLFDRGYLWHESHVITTEQMLELENHVNAIVTASHQQLLRELEGQKRTAGKIDDKTGLRLDIDWLPLSVIQDKLKLIEEKQ